MTRTIWELLVCRAHVERNPHEITKRTQYFLPTLQTIRSKMWTWAMYHGKRIYTA